MKTGNQLLRVSGVLLGWSLICGSSISQNAACARSHDTEAKAAVPSTAVIPEGWRRTKYGWEHTSTWTSLFANASINELIAIQRHREPAWIRYGFAKLRAIPPLMVAVLQITAIAVIVNIAENHRRCKAKVEPA